MANNEIDGKIVGVVSQERVISFDFPIKFVDVYLMADGRKSKMTA